MRSFVDIGIASIRTEPERRTAGGSVSAEADAVRHTKKFQTRMDDVSLLHWENASRSTQCKRQFGGCYLLMDFASETRDPNKSLKAFGFLNL